ncbi:hypothetical protein [Capnocytophaga gingivalis]|jgi:hypothetical protein|uniref:restriction endonuclease n=1 Tax=Capnocytophaga gingivalis TaxID=1017 RepID=UPI0023FA2255|nr:hypothetical protein [Capnocytophaga gingivalis]
MREQKIDIFTESTLRSKLGINTPMGHYNPDWAIVFKGNNINYIYFIAENQRK